MPLVSPITGVISDIGRCSKPITDGITIYQSSFFKMPLSKRSVGNNDFIQISLGKGLSDEQSKAGALCESIERYACQYQGDEFNNFGKINELDGRGISPDELVFYSAKQYKSFHDQDYEELFVSRRFGPEVPIHWTCCWSLTHREKCHVPFTYCYANTPYDKDAVIRFNSNGCAGGNTLEEAVIQGFYELVERDATAIWWYNKLRRPAVKLDELDSVAVHRIKAFLEKEWDFWLLDLTHDISIPVLAAIGRNKKSGEFRFGFGCHLNPHIACYRALTEMCQLISIGDAHSKRFNFRSLKPEPYLLPDDRKEEKTLRKYSCKENIDITEDIAYCVKRMEECGFEVAAHDYTRPNIPLFTVKTIIPGLCHIWPQFGNKRLYGVPVALGWRKNKLAEDELNPLPLLV